MTSAEFLRRCRVLRSDPESRSNQAAKLVLVDKLGQREAARQCSVDVSVVSRAVHRIRLGHCPRCGIPL